MDGIADMGGTQGWGPTHPPLVDEPVFAETWQGRAFALALLSTRLAGWNIDAFRHALERLSRSAYLDDGYFGRWLNAAELVLTDSAILAPSAVEARARNLRGQQVRGATAPSSRSGPTTRRPPRAPCVPWMRRRPSPSVSGCGPRTCRGPAIAGCRATCAGTAELSSGPAAVGVAGHERALSRARTRSTSTRFGSTRTSCGVPTPNRSHSRSRCSRAIWKRPHDDERIH